MKQKVAEKHRLGAHEMHHDVAVAMGRAEVAQPHGLARQMPGELVRESLGRRHDLDRVVVRQGDAALEPAARRIVGRHQLEHVLPEQEADLRLEIADRPAIAGTGPEILVHRVERLAVRDDGHAGKHRVAGRVVEMAVRVDHRTHG